MKWYGSVTNRIEERIEGVKPEIGMGVTEYLWSDRNAYEIIDVIDEKHFKMRRYDVKNIGSGYGDNSWELISNPDGYVYEMVFRYGKWYEKYQKMNYDENGNKYPDGYGFRKMNIRIGVADYYYDFEF